MSALIGLRFDGLGDEPASPSSIFNAILQYVSRIYEAVTSCEAVEEAAERQFMEGEGL